MEDSYFVLCMYSMMDTDAAGKYFFNLAKKFNVKLYQSQENSVVAHSRDVLNAFVEVCSHCVTQDDIFALDEILANAPKGCEKFIPTFAASSLCVQAKNSGMLMFLLNRGFKMDMNKVVSAASKSGRVDILGFLKSNLPDKCWTSWSGSSLPSPHPKTVDWLRDTWLPLWGCTVNECQNDAVERRGYDADGLSSDDTKRRFCSTHLKEYEQILEKKRQMLDKKRSLDAEMTQIEEESVKKFKVKKSM